MVHNDRKCMDVCLTLEDARNRNIGLSVVT